LWDLRREVFRDERERVLSGMHAAFLPVGLHPASLLLRIRTKPKREDAAQRFDIRFELGRDEARPLSTKWSGRAKFHLGLVVATRCDKADPSPNHAPRFWLRLHRVLSDAG
jgi:hypothetical protein